MNMRDNKFEGIATTYNGIKFRSRLEATWAAFFDQMEWLWEYEPFDLNGWIPDFLLKGPLPLLIEVKPIADLSEAGKYADKIIAAEPAYPVALIGTGPVHRSGDAHYWAQMGVVIVPGERFQKDVSIGWCREGCGDWIYYDHTGNHWFCGKCRLYAAHCIGDEDGLDNALSQDWAEAKNAVQWRPGGT